MGELRGAGESCGTEDEEEAEVEKAAGGKWRSSGPPGAVRTAGHPLASTEQEQTAEAGGDGAAPPEANDAVFFGAEFFAFQLAFGDFFAPGFGAIGGVVNAGSGGQ
jgi:hypothetical protein